MKLQGCLWICLLFVLSLHAQEIDSAHRKQLEDVVVTANRGERSKGNAAVPVLLISARQIAQTGSLRLQNILEEQTGISVVNSNLGTSLNGYPNPFGQGIQLLGLDPAYTLILLDGEPLIGRNAGILKLGRLTTGNIRQVEIVKGPASSLYGSEAMAGVINILTRMPQQEQADIQWQAASNQTFSGTLHYTNKWNKTGADFFGNFYRSGGYDLDKTIYGQTVDPFRNLSLAGKLVHDFSEKNQLTLSVRSFGERQNNNYQIVYEGNLAVVKGHTSEKDLSSFVQWKHQPNDRQRWYFRTFFNRYANDAFVNIDGTNIRFDETTFHQSIVKPEIQYESQKGKQSRYVAGAGAYVENIDASRYAGSRNLLTLYAFTQKEWYLLQKRLSVVAGGRLDKRNDFNMRVSPRIALSWKPDENWKFYGSAGWGFKAPDFRHMYLSFYNAQIGYSLIGALELGDQLTKLKAQGLIDPSVDITPYLGNNALKPETSVGFYAGAKYRKGRFMQEAGLFRNDVNNLIEVYALPFGRTNQQAIYSYRNISRIYTQGFETSFQWAISRKWSISGGYQYLETADKEVLAKIRRKELFSRNLTTFDTDTLRRSEYGGLFNRSRHTANCKLTYEDEKKGWVAFVRMIYRGRFGFSDLNGNAVLDDDKEYVKGFVLGNVTLSKSFSKGITIQAACDNLINYTNPSRLPQYPGRTWLVNIQFSTEQLFKHIKK